MPFKTDNIPINDPFLNRRIKLLPCQREMVHYWYLRGMAIRAIGRMFRVNNRTIQFILFPERLKRNKELRKARGGSMIYYNREANNESVKDHRRYKYKILKEVA